VEADAVRTLLAAGELVVAAGGGGIPVARRDGRLDGVDAVIDKDLASALLASALDAERLLVLTQVPAVYERFGTPDERALRELRPGRDDALLERLPAGSMRPKVEACFGFVTAGGREALITSADALPRHAAPGEDWWEALKHEAGTLVVPASAP
jgi:carbamate kinase